MTFARALRAFLRQDPDIIMVGEIRDRETAEIAINASLTGHMVFSTLHTNDAAGAFPRLIDMGVEPFLIASAVAGVMGQRLCRRLCPQCKKEVPLDMKYYSLDTPPERNTVQGPPRSLRGAGSRRGYRRRDRSPRERDSDTQHLSLEGHEDSARGRLGEGVCRRHERQGNLARHGRSVMPGLSGELRQKLTQSQTLAPQMRQGLELLAMSLPELRQRLHEEMSRNPCIEDILIPPTRTTSPSSVPPLR